MRPFAFVAVTLFIAAVAAQVCAGGDDAKKLEGTWEVAELIVGGMKVPDKDIQGMKFVFTKDKDESKLTIVPPKSDSGIVEKRVFTLKINAKAKPATVDLTALDGEFKGTTSPGIFEINGNVMRWCQSDDPKEAKRPTDFKSPEKSSIYVFTFNRAK